MEAAGEDDGMVLTRLSPLLPPSAANLPWSLLGKALCKVTSYKEGTRRALANWVRQEMSG